MTQQPPVCARNISIHFEDLPRPSNQVRNHSFATSPLNLLHEFAITLASSQQHLARESELELGC